MNDVLLVPSFARLTDYLGAWLIEPHAYALLRQMADRMDMRAHVETGARPIVSAIEKTSAPGAKSIAIIKATGLLMKSQSSMGGTSTIQLRRDIRQAAADDDVSGILLAIDSPGGTVAGTDDLAVDVRAAAKNKPVWAHVEDLGASAAYWIASQASNITANSPTALVGSIGTLQVIYDQSAAAEQQGVRTLVFRTGPLKGLGTPGDKVTEEQAAHIQSLVDSVQKSFDAAVMKGRGLSAKDMAAVRTGGVFTASDALDKKLIDGVQPLGKTIDQFRQALKTGTAGQATKSANGTIPMLRRSVLPMLANRGIRA